jgi:hypothetical protein
VAITSTARKRIDSPLILKQANPPAHCGYV